MSQLLKAKDICKMLQIDNTTLWRWRNKGLPCIKIGTSENAPVRFDKDKVMAWVEQQNKEA